jgi:hypothetical protein
MFAVAAGITLACVLQWWTFSRAWRRIRAASAGRPSPDAVSAATDGGAALRPLLHGGGRVCLLQLSSDRWAVKVYLNDAAVGLFAVAYQMASVPA